MSQSLSLCRAFQVLTQEEVENNAEIGRNPFHFAGHFKRDAGQGTSLRAVDIGRNPFHFAGHFKKTYRESSRARREN